ncbi:hypothetical protein KKHLCK_06345 [Candidatus Electrothrix laxa]
MSNIARIWQKEGRIGEALAMARLASRYSNQAEILALFAELLEVNGDLQKAIKVMQVVVRGDALYADRLREMQNRLDTQE